MRHLTRWLAGALALLVAHPLAAQAPAPPPLASLVGAWAGGIVPPPVTLSAQECLAEPSVIFTGDVVMRIELNDPAYSQRVITGARATEGGMELVLGASPAMRPASFGCADPNVLNVQRQGDNQISFPQCREFPYPLIRCAAH